MLQDAQLRYGSADKMPQSRVHYQTTRRAAPVDRTLLDATTVLVVDASHALALLSPRPGQQCVVLTRKMLLTSSMIASVRPDAVIGPLITRDWDIVDLGVALEALGFHGDLFALTQPLPRAELVIREVSAVCQSLRVHLLETG